MYVIDVNIAENREVVLSSNNAGNSLENNITMLNFTIPQKYSDYYKYLDIIKGDKETTQTVVSTADEYRFSYKLPYELTGDFKLCLQLVLKKGDEVFKTNLFYIVFNGSICATQYIEDEYQDTIEFIMENKADLSYIDELKGKKLDKDIFYDFADSQNMINSTKVDKIENKALSSNDYTDTEKEKLLNLPSRSELDESINLKADAASVYNKETTDSKLNSKVDKEEGKVLSSNDYSDAEKEKLNALPENADLNSMLSSKQDKADNSFNTESKTVSGAINELKNTIDNKLATGYTTEEKEKLNELPYKNELNTSFANSLKAKESGASIELTDISPISHNLKGSLSSNTITDFSSVNITARGKNLLNPNVYLTPQTKYGVTLSYIPEEDVFCLNGTSTGTPLFQTPYPYNLILDTTSNYRLSSKIVSGTATYADDTVRVFYLGVGDEPDEQKNWLTVDIKTDAKDGKGGAAPTYNMLTYVWIYRIMAGDTFDNYKFRIQLEKGSAVTEYERFVEPQTVKASVDGSVEGLISASPTTILESDNSEVVINCEYNKDINKAFAELQQAINSLGGNI